MLPLIVGGALAYMYFTKKDATKAPAQPTSRPSNYQPAQPSQQYPWSPIVPPRVDNSNQPWYNAARSFMATPGDNSVSGVAGSVSSVVHSVGDVWGQLDDWFGGNTAKSNLVSTDSVPSLSSTDVGDSSTDTASDQDDLADTDNSYSDYDQSGMDSLGFDYTDNQYA